MKFALHYAVRSNKGLVRGNNEDSAYAGPRLLAIADGMGGHAGGEVASKIVIVTIEELDEDRPGGDVITSLREAVEDANDSLADAVRNDKALEGMGTTLTALRFAGTTFGVVHVGDSRAYLLRGGRLTQITHDDTYVQSLVDAGRLTLDEASQHPRKSVILRALNGAAVDPDVSIREARLGDRYLLCTDGLTDVVRAETLREALSEGDPQDCADRLVALALRGGGPDNVTCIVADVVAEGQGDDVPVVAGAVVDPSEDSGDDDSPAARAAGLSGRGIPVARPRRPERRWTRVIVPIAIVVFLAAAATGTWFWTQRQYFVGQSGSIVAVFRGVDTKLGPMRFYRVVDRTSVKVTDLRPAARDQIDSGITANSRADADAIVARLKSDQLLPVCAVPTTPSATPTTTPSVTATHTTAHKKVAPSTTKTKPKKKVVKTTTPKTKASKTPAKSGKAVAKASKTPVRKTTTKPTPTPTPTPTPAASQTPGTDCRPAR